MQIPGGYILITKVEYEQLRKDNERLRKQAELLRVKELEGMLNQDGHNRHQPPGSNEFNKQPSWALLHGGPEK